VDTVFTCVRKLQQKSCTITTLQPECLGGWLGCHIFVSVHDCFMSKLFPARQFQTAMRPLPLFLCVSVGSLNFGPHPEASERLGSCENFLLEIPRIPAAYGLMLTLHLTCRPSFYIILNQTTITPHTSILWLLRKPYSMTVITIKHIAAVLVSHNAL